MSLVNCKILFISFLCITIACSIQKCLSGFDMECSFGFHCVDHVCQSTAHSRALFSDDQYYDPGHF